MKILLIMIMISGSNLKDGEWIGEVKHFNTEADCVKRLESEMEKPNRPPLTGFCVVWPTGMNP